MTHRNASLTPVGRRKLAQLVVDGGWSYRRAAERCQTSPATAKKRAAGIGAAAFTVAAGQGTASLAVARNLHSIRMYRNQ